MRTAALILGTLLVTVPTEADSFSIRLGLFSPRGDSQLWAENVGTFDYSVNDFDSLFAGVAFDVELNEYVDVEMGVDGYSRTVASRYRDFVRDDGSEIVQDIRLRVAPIVFGEFRRHFVRAEHGGDFASFGDFDLGATQLGFGITFRF